MPGIFNIAPASSHTSSHQGLLHPGLIRTTLSLPCFQPTAQFIAVNSVMSSFTRTAAVNQYRVYLLLQKTIQPNQNMRAAFFFTHPTAHSVYGCFSIGSILHAKGRICNFLKTINNFISPCVKQGSIQHSL
jgi:hypothetical protein